MSPKMKQRMWRVRGFDRHGFNKTWIFRNEADALWRVEDLAKEGKLEEFSYTDVEWKPVPVAAWPPAAFAADREVPAP